VSLRDVLLVHRLSDDAFESQPKGSGVLFGGLTMAVAVSAAADTVRADMVPKSLHTYFLRGGEWGRPTGLAIARPTDGRTFAARTVTVSQSERTLAHVATSFHLPGSGPDWQRASPTPVPPPEDCDDVAVHLPLADLIQLRPVQPPTGGPFAAALHPYWARPVGPLDAAASAPSAAITFTSDYLVILSVLATVPTISNLLGIKTVDHSIWFHRAVDADDWLLFSTEPVSVSAGRALIHGSVHTRDGILAASFNQEVMIPE
jgi:acyl-CoA thioesterase-2